MSIKDFIRDRLLTFPILILFFINLAKKSLQVSLNGFFKMIHLLPITKQAFSKARKKLKAYTFILLNHKLIEEYYTDNDYPTWKGYRLIAIDGSDIQLPQTEEMKEAFGTAKNQRGSALAMAKISYAYDVLSQLVLDAKMDVFKASERDLACMHVETISHLNHDKTQDLYILDRGYPSLGILFYLCHHKKDFLIRCTTASCFGKVKKVFNSGREDVIIRLYAKEANDDQIKELKKRVPSVDRKNAYIEIRVIVLTLQTGEKELLITSLLDQEQYSKETFGWLYHQRWGVEENYKWHKAILELENFSGQSKLTVEQDFFSLIFTANMSSILMQEAEQEIREELQNKELKYEYKINRRVAIASLRDQLVKNLLDPHSDTETFCQHMKSEFKKYLCPVRSNRNYKRPKKGRLKFGLTNRRCI